MLVTLESWLLGWEPESRYQVNIRIYDDAGGTTSSGWETLSDASHYLELDWQAATGAGANNGSLALYLDGTLERTLSGIDNDTLRVDEVRLGPSTGLDSGTSGTFYLDGFESRRSTYIGPLAGLLPGGRSHLAALRHSLRSQGRLLPPESERNPGFFARLSQTMYRALAAAFLPGMAPAYAGVQPAASVLSAPPAGQTWKTYYSAGSLVAMREITAGGNVLYYLHADHLGSTSLTTCGTATTEGGCDGIALGGEVARQRFYPFGQIRPGATGTMPTDVGFTGQRLDDTGLMHYGARYFSPVVGRFVSADTLVPDPANPQSLNRYSYVQNNPLKYIDPTGHFEDDQLMEYLQDQWGDEWEKIWNEWLANSSWMELLHKATWGDILRGVSSGTLSDLMFVQQVDDGDLATWDVNAGELSKLGYRPGRYGLYQHNGFLEDYGLKFNFLGDDAVEGNYDLKPHWMEPGAVPSWENPDELYNERISLPYDTSMDYTSIGATFVGYMLSQSKTVVGWLPRSFVPAIPYVVTGALVVSVVTSYRVNGITPLVGAYDRRMNDQSNWCPACFSR